MSMVLQRKQYLDLEVDLPYPKAREVKVTDPITGEEVIEIHIFEVCAGCSGEIDTNLEGRFIHLGLIYHEACYQKLVAGEGK